MPSPLIDTDIVLLSKIAAGDENAFTLLFERYRDKLFYYILRHTKSPEIAEEIVTDIFMKLWLGRELAEQIKDIGAFLHKVGYYKVMDFLRTTARHSRLQQVYLDNLGQQETASAAEPLLDDELKALLYQAINQLPPQRKLIYRLSKQEGLSHEQIADMLHLSPSTINNTIVAATRSITDYVKAYAKHGNALSILFLL
ncbi:MAG: sigma-70 family RNA polymerase sigma factor [Agriterribacter sp.]